MTYFEDLTPYRYDVTKTPALNVGWLAPGEMFATSAASDETLAALWQFCTVSVNQTRGLHMCEFCEDGTAIQAERNGERLYLGSAEIRVLRLEGAAFAAPTLIYHYVEAHGYLPPAEFLQALADGPRPPDPLYFQRLKSLGYEWGETFAWTDRDPSLAARQDEYVGPIPDEGSATKLGIERISKFSQRMYYGPEVTDVTTSLSRNVWRVTGTIKTARNDGRPICRLCVRVAQDTGRIYDIDFVK